MQNFSKDDIRDRLNISIATVNNWIKMGVIPSPQENGVYSSEQYNNIIKKIETNSGKLKARANRSFLNETDIIYLSIKEKKRKNFLIKLVETFQNSNLSIFEGICHLGKQILLSNNLYHKNTTLYKRIESHIQGENLFKDFTIENKNDDLLGAFYQSIQSIANKSRGGNYYTPAKLLIDIRIPEKAKVYDPCCGSGGLLIHTLSKNHNPDCIYASDIDENALLICSINLALFFNNDTINPHIEKKDFIFQENLPLFSDLVEQQYDFIISNPPWGSKLSKNQKEILLHQYPTLKTTEVFSIALYNAVQSLSSQGTLLFFLPESILNVSTHKTIREYLLNCKRNIEITPLGMAFKGVQSESILLKLSAKTSHKSHVFINGKEKYQLDFHSITKPDFLISYSVNKQDEKILNKLYTTKHTTLPPSTRFALGIVTGNNKKYIFDTKLDNCKPIYRGKDILPYKLKAPEVFINFLPDFFQQVAPLCNYFSRKIVYQFISERITCVLDENFNLVLNSANIIISDDYPMEILICLFNSPIYSFIYKKKFKSKKVLKQHFQAFPLPILSEPLQNTFLGIYSEIINGRKTQADCDALICQYFGLADKDYNYIKAEVYGNSRAGS